MKKSLVHEIKRYQFISTSFFAMISILISTYLMGHIAYQATTDRLLIASEMLKHEVYEKKASILREYSDADQLNKSLEPSFKKIIQSYPEDMTMGFYSKQLDCVVVSVKKNVTVHLNGKRLAVKESGRETWSSLKPHFMLFWSQPRMGWILECSNPVTIDGKNIGHVFATITFYGLINFFWVFIVAIIAFIGIFWGVAMITNRNITDRIRVNLNQLLLEDFDTRRNFDFLEFDTIYHRNHQAFLNLKRSEKQKSEMLANCPWGYMILDSKGNLIEINEKGAASLGYSRHIFIGTALEKWGVLIPPVLRALNSRTKVEGKTRVYSPILGEERTLFTSSFSAEMVDGEEGLMTWFVDLSEQVKTQEEMDRSNRKMENILESVSDAFFAVDQNLRYTYINKNAERLLNAGNRQELLGKVAHQVLPEYDSKTFIELLNHVYVENEPIRYETYSESKDSWVEVSVFPIEDGLAVFVQDISNRKRLEKALLEERERYLITLGSIGDGVIATNGNGRIVLMNEAAEKLTGYDARNCVGRALKRAFYVIDDKTSEPFTGTLKKVLFSGATLYVDQAVLVTRDLIEIPIALSCAPIKNSMGKIIGAVIVFKDLSVRLKTEMELQKTQKLESLGILAGGIAHDFNNLLAAILLNTELALRLWQKGENIQKLLTQTISTTYKARNLSAQLLTFSKGGAPIKKAMSIQELLRETISFVLRGSSINCIYEIAPDLKLVEIDEGQIVQVLNNLIINAKQAMPKGGTIAVTARNVIKTPDKSQGLAPTEYIEVAIKDQGTGIPKEYLEKIYDPFFSTKREGTGLGLATTYSIIKRHGGSIEVKSQVNVGTTFTLYLPATARIVEEKLTRKETAAASSKLRVLIMDDEEEIRESVEVMLQNLGYETTSATNGGDTINLYKESMRNGQPFDVVIMDLTISGGMGGQEAIAHLRDIDPRITAIVSSGYANDRVLSEYERFGFKGIVEKPYRIETLIETIQQVTKRK